MVLITLPEAARGARTLAGVTLAAALLLAGCGGGSPGAGPVADAIAGKAPAAVAKNARDVTRAAGSSKMEGDFSFTMSGAGFNDSFDGHMTGVYDFAAQIGEFDGTTAGGTVPAMTMHSIVARNVVYERFPGADRWARTDYSKLVNTPIGQQDPSQQLDLLIGISDDVRELGTEQLRGTSVHHYAITIDPKRLVANTTVVTPGSPLESAAKSVTPIPGDVYVDEQGRVRRLVVTIEVLGRNADLASMGLGDQSQNEQLKQMLADRRSAMHWDIQYFDFGTAVSTREPDASKVVDGPLPFNLPR
ncbi:DUF7537 family lipoprotein [Pseudonocardia sp. GCM10023141]|uniref:DUF7537 family lipoprotein n=1 Tax=Pseudonocardia sp. GCM10023141 TaxID=3252653 RepID=UPI00361472A8